MRPEEIMGELERLAKNVPLCLLKLCWTPVFAKLIKDKVLQNFQPFSCLSFCKMLQKDIFPFYICSYALCDWKSKGSMKTQINRGKLCQLFSTMPGIIGIESKGFKCYRLWWFICPSVCFLALLLTPPYCFLHLQLCEHWHLKEREFFFKLHQLICKCETSAFISSFFFF